MKKVLAPYINVGFKQKNLYLGFGSIKKIVSDKMEQEIVLEVLASLKKPSDKSDLFSSLSHKYQDHKLLNQWIDEIFDGPFVIEDEIYDRENRYSRNWLYYNLNQADPLKVQNALESKHVVILGCGGIGNIASLMLSTLGLKHLTLIDSDRIELSNLNRQFAFCEKDVGQLKTSVLKEAVQHRIASIRVDTLEIDITKDNLETIPRSDLMILSADSRGIVPLINEYALRYNIPYLNIGYIQDIACWGPFVIPGQTSCALCQKNIANEDPDEKLKIWVKLINEKIQVPSNSFVNTIAASLGALDAVRYLGGFGQIMSINKRIGLYTHSLQWEHQAWEKNPQCVCNKSH